jgi:outer membrane receptor for ferrienterochelin and colicins
VLDARAGYNQSQTDIDNVLFPEGTTIPIAADGNAGMGTDPLRAFDNGVIGNPSANAVIIDADIALTYDLMSNHVFRFASGYTHEDFDTSETKNFGPGVLDIAHNPDQIVPTNIVDVSNTDFIFIEDVTREVYYFSLQDEWKLADDWELTAGVRYDEYSDVGSTVNPRLALVWAAEYNLTAKFLYGRAFRAPSFTELYSQNNPAQLGNPDLEPETIDTYEAALDYQINRDMNLLVNAFYYEINDLIDLDFDPTAGLRAQNVIDQKGQGLELSFTWSVSDSIDFQTNLTIQDIENKNTREVVAGVADSQFYAAVTWSPFKDFRLVTDVNWIGNRDRESEDLREDIKDYAEVNLTINKAVPTQNIDMSLWVKNLLDEKGKEPSKLGPVFVETDYPIEGRSIFLDIRYHLN